MDTDTAIGSNVVSKRIQKILDLRIENDKDVLDALKELSTFFIENTATNRRNLKSTIEKRSLDINYEFLKSLRNVQSSLDKIYKDVSDMNIAVSDMTSRLQATKAETKTLIDQTTHLQKQIGEVETKQEVVSGIIDRFQLKPNELVALRASNVSSEMLAAVNRAEEIHGGCKVLSQAGCHTLALDIMEQMSLYQESGIDRLFRWTQARSRTIEQPDPSGLLPQAMAKLQARTALFDKILEEYCANRRDLMVRQLISALTRGGRPIEHRVTEPKRYVGDMLAWLHQAIPAERDSLNYLLKHCDTVDVPERIQQCLCSITEGVCHPLKVRVEHIVLGENNVRDPLLLQGVLGLLRYYRIIVEQMVGPGQLERTLAELMETAERTLFVSLTARVALLLSSQVETVLSDLALSPGAAKVLALLGQVLSADSSTPAIVSQTVSCMIEPVLVYVTECAAKLPAVETAVYLLNCYYAIEGALALHPYLDDRLERLKAQSEAQMDTLTSEQASALVGHLGLGAIYTALQGVSNKPVSRLPAFEPGIISNISAKLSKVIQTPDLYLLPQLTLLISMGQRLTVQRRAGAVIHSIYQGLYNAVFDPENLFMNPQELLPITPDSIYQALVKP